MPGKKIDKLKKLAQAKNQFIVDQLQQFEALINSTSTILTQDIISEFVDKLDSQDGEILNSSENIQKVALLEKTFQQFQAQEGFRIISAFVADLTEITKLGSGYYTELIPSQVKSADIEKIINQKLGLEWQGGDWIPKKDGYVNALITNPSLRSEIKKLSYSHIIGKSGPKALREAVKNYIEGVDGKKGSHYKFYETYAFDTYSEIDRLNSKLHADRLKLKYFLFNGGIISDSRIFCVEHSGKCWSTEEADTWKDLIGKFRTVPGKKPGTLRKEPIGPIVENKEAYNPLIELGGIRCRHSADYVSDEIALELRKEQLPKESVTDQQIKEIEKGLSFSGQMYRSEKAIARHRRGEKYMEENLEGIDKYKLTDNEAKVIYGYTDSAFTKINEELYGRSKVTPETLAYEKALNVALDKMPVYKGDVLRVAMISDAEAVIKNYMANVGGYTKFDGFSSASKGNIGWNGNIEFQITSRTGRSIQEMSKHSSEYEVLFKSKSVFKIVKVERKRVYLEED